jgi:1,5-anhydro-D-fructose reductase (1,5-anhydro-D-mannitol-forming)
MIAIQLSWDYAAHTATDKTFRSVYMVRFGIAGFGLHAVRRLMPGFAAAKNCKVTALTRRDLDRARESAKEYGIAHAFTTTAELCACPDVDAVFIASPDAMHLADVLEAARHGKHILVEKPMAMNADEARQMVEAARAAGVILGVAHVMRFEATVRWFRERVASGAIGKPLLGRAVFAAPLLQSARTWINDPTLATGGPLADIGVHCFDTLKYVLNDEIHSVMAQAHYDSHWSVEASGTSLFEFGQGTLAMMSVTARAPYQTLLEVIGEEGILSAVNALNVEVPVTVEHRRGFETVEKREVSNADAYTAQVESFAQAVESKRPFEIPGEVGLANQLVLDAIFRSVKSGRAEAP